MNLLLASGEEFMIYEMLEHRSVLCFMGESPGYMKCWSTDKEVLREANKTRKSQLVSFRNKT